MRTAYGRREREQKHTGREVVIGHLLNIKPDNLVITTTVTAKKSDFIAVKWRDTSR